MRLVKTPTRIIEQTLPENFGDTKITQSMYHVYRTAAVTEDEKRSHRSQKWKNKAESWAKALEKRSLLSSIYPAQKEDLIPHLVDSRWMYSSGKMEILWKIAFLLEYGGWETWNEEFPVCNGAVVVTPLTL